jgi:hypothetical protein
MPGRVGSNNDDLGGPSSKQRQHTDEVNLDGTGEDHPAGKDTRPSGFVQVGLSHYRPTKAKQAPKIIGPALSTDLPNMLWEGK